MQRRGVAAVEFVMVLPLLLLLFVGLVWTGRVSIARATTAVVARHDAWNARQGVRHGPFDFADTTSGIATASAERTVAFAAPAVSATPRATVSVHGDPWGFRTLDMNRPPHWPLMTTALRKAGENRADQVTATVGRIRDVMTELGSIEGLLPGLTDVIPQFTTGILDSKTKAQKDLLAKSGGNLDKAIGEARRNITKLETEVIPNLERLVENPPGGLDAPFKIQLERARGMLEGYERALETLERLETDPQP